MSASSKELRKLAEDVISNGVTSREGRETMQILKEASFRAALELAEKIRGK